MSKSVKRGSCERGEIAKSIEKKMGASGAALPSFLWGSFGFTGSPVGQRWKLGFKIFADLVRRLLLVGHMFRQKIHQLFQRGIHKRPIGVAPFAVFLVEGPVGFPADGGVLQGHAAALADQLAGRTQQGVDR